MGHSVYASIHDNAIRATSTRFAYYVFRRVISYRVVLYVGRGGALVEALPFNRRVVGSNPALTAT